jgi:hypothetical protein
MARAQDCLETSRQATARSERGAAARLRGGAVSGDSSGDDGDDDDDDVSEIEDAPRYHGSDSESSDSGDDHYSASFADDHYARGLPHSAAAKENEVDKRLLAHLARGDDTVDEVVVVFGGGGFEREREREDGVKGRKAACY